MKTTPLTPCVERALARAEIEANKDGSHFLGSMHVLIGILQESDFSILKQAGITEEMIRKGVFTTSELTAK